MIFDWGGRDGVNGSMPCYFEEDEDHIVPFPAIGETGGEHVLSQTNVGESDNDVRTVGPEDGFLSSLFTTPMETNSSFCTGVYQDRFGMDPLSKSDGSKLKSCGVYPGGSTPTTHGDAGVGIDGQRAFSEFDMSNCVPGNKELTIVKNSLSVSMDANAAFDNNSVLSVNEHDDCSDCFLDCGWASIPDFGDEDEIFSDSKFWDEEVIKMDGIFSQTDSFNCADQELPTPDMVIGDMAGENYPPSFQKGELGKRKRMKDENDANAVLLGEQENSSIHFASRNTWNAEIEKVGRKNKPTSTALQNEPMPQKISSTWPSCDSQVQHAEYDSRSQPFSLGTHYHERKPGEGCNLSSCGLVGNPYVLVPDAPLAPPTAAVNEHQVAAHYGDHPFHSVTPNSMRNFGFAPGTSQYLNPQEKVENLTHQQQTQAMLANEMQQKQFNEQMHIVQGSNVNNACAENMKLSGLIEPKTQVSRKNLAEITISEVGHSLEERLFHQLENVISKMDGNLKVCMRDSLFRLARNAAKRMGTDDHSISSINLQYDNKLAPNMVDASRMSHYIRSRDAEPETNQIDRIVVLFLFNKYPQTFKDPVNKGPSCMNGMNTAWA